jgi:tetratricopeptide (TPR) repeat protein
MKIQLYFFVLTLIFASFAAANAQDLTKYPNNVRLKTIYADAKKNHETSPITTGELSDFADQAKAAGKYQLAADCYEQILKVSPDSVEYASLRGELNLIQIKDPKSAVKDFSIVISANKGQYSDYYNRGTAYFQIEKYKEALKDLDKAYELNPKFVSILLNRGLTKYYLKNFDGAISDLTAGIELDPTVKNLYLARAYAYQAKGDEAKANADNATAARLQ